MYPNQPERNREAAKRLLVHYFRVVMERNGGRFDYDNQVEIESIVDAIIEAVPKPPDPRLNDTLS